MKSQTKAEEGQGVGIAEMSTGILGRTSVLVTSKSTMTLARADIAGVSPMPSNLGGLAYRGLSDTRLAHANFLVRLSTPLTYNHQRKQHARGMLYRLSPFGRETSMLHVRPLPRRVAGDMG